jgi:pyruvate formate lyase activating enzyme
VSSGLVFDIRKYSIHDGPGIRTAVFLKGCPLRCAWCHNPEGLSPEPEILRRPDRCVRDASVACGRCARACPLGLDPRREAGGERCRPGPDGTGGCPGFTGGEGALLGRAPCAEACPAEALQHVGRRMSADEVMRQIREDAPFYEESGGGATFTGGEPLLQGEFLLELLRACRAEGIRSALDTSGWGDRALLLEAGRLADLVLFDLKLVDEERHRAATGVPSGPILENLAALAASGAAIALRVPLVPGWNDTPGDLEAAARFAASLPGRPRVHLLPYHSAAKGKYALRGAAYAMGDTAAPSEAAAAEAAACFERAGLSATIGG